MVSLFFFFADEDVEEEVGEVEEETGSKVQTNGKKRQKQTEEWGVGGAGWLDTKENKVGETDLKVTQE